jgi:hypothetical protein
MAIRGGIAIFLLFLINMVLAVRSKSGPTAMALAKADLSQSASLLAEQHFMAAVVYAAARTISRKPRYFSTVKQCLQYLLSAVSTAIRLVLDEVGGTAKSV